MAKLVVTGVAGKKDSSFQGRDGKTIESTDVICSGTVDGVAQQFTVRIYGKGGGDKIKAGINAVGEVSTYNGAVVYVVKKAQNPNLFPQSAGKYNKGGQSSIEASALRLAVSVVELSDVKGQSVDAVAEAVLFVAKKHIIPFIVKSQTPTEQPKKSESEIIREIVNKSGLADKVRSKGLTMGELVQAYEASGKSQDTFITTLTAMTADVVEEDEDDIPF